MLKSTEATKDGIDLESVAAQVYVTRFGVQEMLGVIANMQMWWKRLHFTSLHFTSLHLFLCYCCFV